MDINIIYEQLNAIEDKSQKDISDLECLIKNSNCDDAEIRAYIAELLVDFDCDSARKVLLEMCTDIDEMVRVNACDSLSAHSNNGVYLKLLDVLENDKSLLVKNFALLSLIDIIQNIKVERDKLEEILKKYIEKYDGQIKASSYKGLYVLGNEKSLDDLLEMLYYDDYKVRCNVINVLRDVVVPSNSKKIIAALENCKKTENSKAVATAMEELLQEIDENTN